MVRHLRAHVSALLLIGSLASTVRAQSSSLSLEDARRLFGEALNDEQRDHHPEVALPKYQQVATVKDTAQVEYRIGSCLELLGKLRGAAKAYEAAARLGLGNEDATDVVEAAHVRVAALAPKMTKLTIAISGADNAEVVLDDQEKLTDDDLKRSTLVDPGDHVVEARAPHMKPTRVTFGAIAGANLSLTLTLKPEDQPVITPPVPLPPVPLPPASNTRVVVGVSLLSLGGASAVTAIALLFVRESDISKLNNACPGGLCPPSRQDELTSLRSQALTFGPLAAVFGGVAVVSAAAGILALSLAPTPRTSVRLVPAMGHAVAGLDVEGSF